MREGQENMTGMMQGFNWMIQVESSVLITKSKSEMFWLHTYHISKFHLKIPGHKKPVIMRLVGRNFANNYVEDHKGQAFEDFTQPSPLNITTCP